jgi:hypothetical protein
VQPFAPWAISCYLFNDKSPLLPHSVGTFHAFGFRLHGAVLLCANLLQPWCARRWRGSTFLVRWRAVLRWSRHQHILGNFAEDNHDFSSLATRKRKHGDTALACTQVLYAILLHSCGSCRLTPPKPPPLQRHRRASWRCHFCCLAVACSANDTYGQSGMCCTLRPLCKCTLRGCH